MVVVTTRSISILVYLLSLLNVAKYIAILCFRNIALYFAKIRRRHFQQVSTKCGEIYCYIVFQEYSTIIRQNSSSTFLVGRHATNFVAFPYKISGKKRLYSRLQLYVWSSENMFAKGNISLKIFYARCLEAFFPGKIKKQGYLAGVKHLTNSTSSENISGRNVCKRLM